MSREGLDFADDVSYLREGTIEKNYQHAFVMLLRLRQATAHPYLLRTCICLEGPSSADSDAI